LAARKLGALLPLGLGFIRSTFFRDQASIFSEESIKYGPAPRAALGKVIAAYKLLNGELPRVPPLHFESGFHHLDKAYRVARATTFLVPHWPSEVKPVNVREVKSCGDLLVWNGISSLILFLESLELFNGGLKNFALAEWKLDELRL
jgi:hypothetical protein